MCKKEMNAREKIKMKFNGKCAYCGEVLPDKGWHIDHLQPVKRNYEWNREKQCWIEIGSEHPERDNFNNKLPACASCNINKHSMSIEEFRKVIEDFVSSCNKRFTQYKIAKRYGLIEETGKKVVSISKH